MGTEMGSVCAAPPAELQALLAAASALPCSGTVLGQEGWLLPEGKFCLGSQSLSQRRWWFHQTLVLVGLVHCKYFKKKKNHLRFHASILRTHIFVYLRNQFPFIL